MFILLIIIFIYGIAIGSFLNVLIDRLSNEESIGGRSHCDYCKKTLRWIDLIPVFSYVSLGGKCRYCHKKLSAQYPLVEILTGFVFVLAWTYSPFGAPAMRILSIVLAGALEVILIADLKYQIIPDEMQIVVGFAALALLILHHAPPNIIGMRFLEGLAVMAPILLLYLVTKGKGMGFGDVKLAFVIGLLLGAYAGFLALYIAFLSGAVVGIFLLVRSKKKMKSRIAFGPFLVLGIIVMFFMQNQVFLLVDKFLHTR